MTRKPFVLSISLLAFFFVGVLRSDIAEAQGRRRGGSAPAGAAVSRQAPPSTSRTGTAVPRQAAPGGRVIAGPPIRGGYYYSPYRYYPYGYGAFGLGYLYYDPYLWGYPPAYGYYGGYGYGYDATGAVRIDVKPNIGSVSVDGYYAGRVDDYDGTFQSLKLEPGVHHIQVTAPGYAPLDFDVRIDPGQKVTYRGAMIAGHP